jgi:DNA helicase-2/ATP-dependent DNA helicase PcrA
MGYRRYQKSLKNAGAVDFDDLLLCTEEIFQKFPEARREEAGRFDHLLVDEYQDTNGSQYRIVKALASGHRNLCVVGDDDQSIYGWRGADVTHILQFAKDWPSATVVRLEENYRSTAEILAAANRLILFNKQRHDKVLRAARPGGEKPRIEQYKDETEEAKRVVEDIGRRLAQPGHEPRDFAILFRTNEQPRAFETELRKAKLPYVLIGGMSFFDRKEVRDILAYLKTLAAPQDEVSLLRIINTPPRGIGSKTVETLMAEAVKHGRTLWDVLSHPEHLGALPPNARAAVGAFVGLIEEYRAQLGRGPLADLARRLIAKIDYQGELRRLYPDANEMESRWNAVEEVVNALAAYEKEMKARSVSEGAKKPQLSDFLDEVALGGREFDDEKDNQLKRNAIALMTLHSAKGLEFPHVYMVGLEEGLLPHHRSIKEDGSAIDEERRLCYVGLTRAQERLTLSLALTRMKWGKPRDSVPSRFLFEITGAAERPQQKRAARPKTATVRQST